MKFRAYNTTIAETLRLLPFLCVLLFAIGTLLRAIFLDDTDGDAGLLLDHFIASVVAKNISQGLGWVTTGYETFLLNPESLNTGPTVVVPMALAIAVFGNQLAVPGLAMATLNVLLLFGVLLQSRRYWPALSQHTLFMLPLLALFASLWPHGWYRAGGEVTAALLLTNAALLLATSLREHSTLDWRTALLAGLLAGLAATSKQLALLACAGLACAIFFSPKFHVRWKIRLLFCLSMALPYGAFTLYQQLAALSADRVWWAGTEFYRSQLFERYSGLYVLRMYLDPEIPLWPAVVNNATNALRTVQEQLVNTSSHPAVWLFWPPLLAASLVLAWRKKYTYPLAWFLVAAALPLLAWFFLMAGASILRYLHVGLYLSALTCMAATATLNTPHRIAASITLAALCLLSNTASHGFVATLPGPVPRSLDTAFSWPVQPSETSQAIHDMSHYLEQHAELPVSMPSYWTVNPMEYLSPRRNIFLNTLDEIARHAVFDETAYLAQYPEIVEFIREGRHADGRSHFLHPDTPRKYQGRFKLVDPVNLYVLTFSGGSTSERPPFCSSIKHHNSHYMILHCNNTDIEQFTGGVLSVRPQIWMRPQRIYPNENEFF